MPLPGISSAHSDSSPRGSDFGTISSKYPILILLALTSRGRAHGIFSALTGRALACSLGEVSHDVTLRGSTSPLEPRHDPGLIMIER